MPLKFSFILVIYVPHNNTYNGHFFLLVFPVIKGKVQCQQTITDLYQTLRLFPFTMSQLVYFVTCLIL